MRKLTVLLLLLTVFFATSNATVPKTSAGRVTYKVSYNGKISETGGITVTYLNNTVRIDRAGMDGVKIQGMPSETGYIDYAGQKVFQV
ncbi:MAG: hypothetical protein Q8862_10575, partial [Bacteroidota bacterium]|nr:hypothetical protein [Bacteroidota bacterium]